MLRNYFKTAFRTILKHKLFSGINIFGLSIGLASCILIMSFVMHELSFDQYHEKAERIYRLRLNSMATTFPALYPFLLSDFPEIETAARVYDAGFSGIQQHVQYEDKTLSDLSIYFADSTLLDVFDFKLISGNPQKLLHQPGTVIITQSTAIKLFGNQDPIGKVINYFGTNDLMITGVLEDIPSNSHFHFDMAVNMHDHPWHNGKTWNGIVFATYIVLNEGADPDFLASKIKDLVAFQFNKAHSSEFKERFYLQKLSDIHLHSHFEFELEANSDIKYIWIFSTIALFTLIIAVINFVNLSTSRSIERAREVGLRKLVGANNPMLFFQYLGESLIVTFISLVLAIVIIHVIQPYLYYLIGYDLNIDLIRNPLLLSGIVGIYLIVSFCAGSYPALILTRYMPSEVLKGAFHKSGKGTWLRKAMVIFQFVISLVLIASTLVVQKQTKYVQQAKLGYNKEHTIVIPLGTTELKSKIRTIKNELLNTPGVKNITSASQVPANITLGEGIDLSASGGNKNITMSILPTDKEFFKTMNIEFISGQGFTKDFNDGDITQYVINEAALELLDWFAEEALGREIRARKGRPVTQGPIVGVIKNFHFQSFHEDIAPLVLFQLPRQLELMLVKIDGQDIPGTIKSLDSNWKAIAGGVAMDYRFLDQDFDMLYSNDARIGRLFSSFALIAICIACLGLFGLVSLSTIQKTKEIGIRKVMGAKISDILSLLIKDMAVLIMVAIIIGLPIAQFAMKEWLASFAYKTNLGPLLYIVSGILILLISGITISYHTIQAATRNPVDSLRYE